MGRRKGRDDPVTVRLSQLALQAGVVVKGVDRELPLTVRVDSRETQKGEGFVALRGTKVDGHRFIPDVLAKGGRADRLRSGGLSRGMELAVSPMRFYPDAGTL